MNGSKKWIIKTQNEDLVKELSKKLNITEITARLLINRGYCDVDDAVAFLS